MSTANSQPDVGRSSALLMPNRYKDHPVAVRRNHAGVIIVVHGVNDVGVSYHALDSGLCAGLNERLDRPDLFPNDFRLPDDGDAVVDDPDAIYYRRLANDNTNSPVIPFYWGYKAAKAEVAKEQINEQNVDKFGNRLDKMLAKNGGMFANATSNIPDMFGGCFEGGFTVWLTNKLADKAHIIAQAPDRRYMALAAQRLAALIRQIRLIDPNDTITLIGHSQGCLVSLTAQAFLHEAGERYADCLIMCHPPYGLHEPLLDYLTQSGSEQQTTEARVETLVNLVSLITGSPHRLPPFETLAEPSSSLGRTGLAWSPTAGRRPPADGDSLDLSLTFAERDNRGKVYLYFCPHDLTVGLATIQGIGTLGVPAQVNAGAEERTECRPIDVLCRLGPGFRQRVWTWRERDGGPVKVGTVPGRYIPRLPGEKAYDGGFWETLGRVALRPNEAVEVSGEALNPPLRPSLHLNERRAPGEPSPTGDDYVGELPLDPIDACNAVVKEGQLPWKWDEQRYETPTEARGRLQRTELMPNSYHSSIVANLEHHRWVTAMDVAIGQAHCMDDPEWRNVLLAIADWRTDLEEEQSNLANFDKLAPDIRELVWATYRYYNQAEFPSHLVPTKAPAPVVNQTRAERTRGIPPRTRQKEPA